MILQDIIDEMSRCRVLTVEELDMFDDVWKTVDKEVPINDLTRTFLTKELSRSRRSELENKLAAEVMIRCLVYANQRDPLNNRPTFTARDLMTGAKELNPKFKVQWQDGIRLKGK